jgi:KRAB domain-containing zinc finger protein
MQPGVLKTHSLIHKGERPFTCEVCKKRFLLAWHLRRHALTHSGVKPYACDLCGKEFNQSSNLKRHFPTHSREKVRRNAQTLDYS